MMNRGLAIIMLVLCSASYGDDPPVQPPQPRTRADRFRSLSADYDREVKAALEDSKAARAANAQRVARADPTAAVAVHKSKVTSVQKDWRSNTGHALVRGNWMGATTAPGWR
jgi:hypothetical protein